MQKIAKTRGVKGAASWCALAAMLFLLTRLLLQGGISLLMSFRVKGASLADPAGFSQTAVMLLTMFISLAAAAVPVVWLLRTTRLGLPDLRLTLPGQWSPAFCMLLFLGAANFANLFGGILGWVLGAGSRQSVLPAAGLDLVLSFLALCVLPAVCEELLFRGALQGLLRPSGSAAAIVGPAVLFALLHLELTQCITALVCGLFLGWLAERTGSILPGMLLHFVNNCIAFLDIYLLLYAPEAVATAVELVVLLGFPLVGGVVLHQAIQEHKFSFGEGMRPGVTALAVFQSPAYTVAAAFLAVYTLYLSLVA